jgi:putative glutamine transport system substrate-binding protein
VRYDLQPFSSVTGDGGLAGFDVDLGRELARRWLGDAEAVQFRQVRSDTAVERLEAGEVDIVIAALTHTRDREAGADFTLPYFIDGQALLVRSGDTAHIDGPAGLEGRRVGVVTWSDARDALRGAVPYTLTLQAYDRFDGAVAALGRGEVDAVAETRRRLFWGTRMLPGSVVVGQYTTVPAAIAFPQNDRFFADLVNLTLQDMVADGTYSSLYGRWFGPEEAPAVERWPGDGPTPALASSPIVAAVPDTISKIESRGRLVVALVADRPPYAYVDASGALAGYEVDLVRSMASYWLGDVTAVDFVPVSAAIGKEMVFTGQADVVVGAVEHTRQGELEMDFSQTTYVAGEGLMIQAGTPVTRLESLHGQMVAVVDGSGSAEALLSAAQGAGVSVAVAPQPTLETAIALLAEGQVAAVVADRAYLLGPAYATPELEVLPGRLTQVPLALGLPAGDSAFRDLVNLTLQQMKADGQFDGLYSIWFGDAAPAFARWPGAPYRTLRLAVAPPAPAGG